MEKLQKILITACLVTTAFSLILGGCAKPAVAPAPASTVTPSPTPSPTPAPTPTISVKLADSTNDLFDNAGRATAGEPYLDIVETTLSSFDTYYLATIELNNSLPAKLDDPSIFIEWAIFVDVDSNPATGWNYPLLFNDIGPDYLFRLSLTGSQYTAEVLDIKANKFSQMGYRVSGSSIELRIPKATIQSDSFNYVSVVSKDGGGGIANALLIADKSPNQGHGQFP